MTRTQLSGSLLASVLALACAGSAVAEQTAVDETPAVAAGMRVFKDPVTGEFREPTADEVRALEQAAPRGPKAVGKSVTSAPINAQRTMMMTSSGAVGMDVPESAFNYLVVTRGADGKLHQACAQGEDAAVHAAHANMTQTTVAQETVYETQ